MADADDIRHGDRGRRLPSLGPRGEGWVALQAALIVAALAAGLTGPGWPAAVGAARVGASLALLVAGLLLFAGGSQRLGRQLTPFPRPRAAGGVKQGGAYRLVRHPIYGGVLLLAWAWALWSSPWALLPALLALPFFAVKSLREEAWLCERYPEYAAYSERVPRRFLPFVW